MDRKDEQSLADNVDADPKQGTPSLKFLSWPPPGLEAVQGKLWPPIALIALGDVTLILPLLWSIATQQEPWSFGPFGGNWWIPLLTTFVGLVVLLNGLGRLFGLLRLAAKAGKRGHGWLVVVQVVADFPRDTGFLIQGARLFSETPPAKRSLMLVTRVIGAGAYILAALWVPLGFIVSLLIGARGLLGPAGVWFITVAPAALLLLVGLLSRLLGRKLSWEANRDGTLRAAVDEEICSQIAEWNDESSSMRKDLGFDGAVAPHSRSFRLGALSVALLAVFVMVPVVTVTLTGAVGTVLAAIAVPSFNNPQARVAVAEMLRHHKLEPDGSVTAEQAGEALHALLSVNLDTHERVLDRAPVRVYGQDWFPDDVDSLISGSRGDWARGLFERVGRGLGPDERAYLADMGAHPAHAEFRTIAMADSVDIIGARYVLPFPDTVTPFELPIPSFIAIRNGTDAHVALAALQLLQGNQSRAEETIREVISLGFAMIDEGSSIIDGMIGARVVDVGAQALELLFGATGRTDEAESLRWLRTGMEAALERAAVTRTGFDAEGALRMMPDAVLDETVLRGIRWEYFLTFATLAPCVNLNNVVFGPGQSYEQWLEDAERALVRRPSDEAMFRFLEKGWFRGAGAAEAPAWIKAALRFTFGEASGGTCAAQLGAMDMIATVQ